jgi:hypothetical protein
LRDFAAAVQGDTMIATEQDMKSASMPKPGLLGAARARTQGTAACSLARRRAGVAFLAAVCLAFVAVPSVAFGQAPEAHLLSKTFGAASSTPSDPYPLTDPTDVAVDNSSGPSNGDIYVGNPSADEEQTISISGATGGTFTLSFDGEATEAIPYKSSFTGFNGEDMERPLAALGAIGQGNVSVGEIFQGPNNATITFIGKFAETEVEQMTCDAKGLIGTGASCTVATTVQAAHGNFVEKFSSAGEFLSMFGEDVNKSAVEQARPEAERDVCPAPGHPGDVCQDGSRGTGPGEFVGEGEFEDGLIQPRRLRLSRLYLAVDGSGDLYVGDPGTALITKFDEAGEVLSSWGTNGQLGPFTATLGRETFSGIAIDPASDLFVWGPAGEEVVKSFGSTGTPRSGSFEVAHGPAGLAVDEDDALYPGAAVEPATNDRYLLKLPEGRFVEHLASHCHGEEIEENPCMPLEQFGVGELSDPEDVAVGSGSVVYLANTGAKNVAVFTRQPIEAPGATIEPASEVSYTSAHISGTVNPHGTETTCEFEYVTDVHFKEANGFAGKLFRSEGARREAEEHDGYEPAGYQSCESSPGSGTGAVAVRADLSGLKPGTEYHVRLIARSRLGAQTSSEEQNPMSNSTFDTESVVAPLGSGLEAREVTASSAHFVAEINPDAPEPAPTSVAVEAGFKVRWRFECTPECPREHEAGGGFTGEMRADDTSHEISVEATELQPGTSYEVALVAENAGGPGPEPKATFKTATVAPQIDSTSLVFASSTEAIVAARIRPGGAATTYHVQYIPEAQFLADGEQFGDGALEVAGSSTVGEDDKQHGLDDESHEAQAMLTGLGERTTYRYRFVAHNEVATEMGPAEALYTYVAPVFSGCLNEQLREEDTSKALADCRAYEQVSTEGDTVYQPEVPGKETREGYRQGWYPMQSTPNGEAVSFVAEPASSGRGCGTGNSGNGEGDEYLATRVEGAKRGEGGWSSSDVMPCGAKPETFYEAFSANLSEGILTTANRERPLSPGVETSCNLLYSRAGAEGAYSPLFTSESTSCRQPFYVGGSANGSARVFESSAKQVEGSQEAEGKGHENIYDSASGQLHLVNVLPGGKADPDASVGRLASGEEVNYAAFEGEIVNGVGVHIPSIDTSGAVSSDGSKIFFTNLATGIIYARENPTEGEESASSGGKCAEAETACTVKVSAGAASYQTATPDGRFAYYTEAGRLWRFDSESGTGEALTAAGSEVQGVIGVNQVGADGSYIYFVAAGNLAPGAEVRTCSRPGEGTAKEKEEAEEEAQGEEPSGRGCNLYVLHEGETKLVAVLSPHDQEFDGYSKSQGDWRATLGSRSAELTPDGTHLVFLSTRRLTAYRNAPASGGTCANGGKLLPCPEVYIYDAPGAQVACASCQPAGLPPIAAHGKGGEEPATYVPGDFGSIMHMRRWISADGDRVFFDTAEALLPEDTNGLYDVYEWERAGTGSCTSGSALDGGGCLFLLSGGGSEGRAFFIDSDKSGDNAFFVTRSALLPGQRDERPVLYDARVEGGFVGRPGEVVEPPECLSAEGCKKQPTEPPAKAFPASAAFSGSGNLIAPLEVVKPVEKPVVRKLTRAQQLAKALKACRKDRLKEKRAKCETSARKKYGPKPKKKTRKKATKRGSGR